MRVGGSSGYPLSPLSACQDIILDFSLKAAQHLRPRPSSAAYSLNSSHRSDRSGSLEFQFPKRTLPPRQLGIRTLASTELFLFNPFPFGKNLFSPLLLSLRAFSSSFHFLNLFSSLLFKEVYLSENAFLQILHTSHTITLLLL